MSKQKTGRTRNSQRQAGSTKRSIQHVTPTSERIIRKTSIKRHQAMKVLAER